MIISIVIYLLQFYPWWLPPNYISSSLFDNLLSLINVTHICVSMGLSSGAYEIHQYPHISNKTNIRIFLHILSVIDYW